MKEKPRKEDMYDGTMSSGLLFQARTGSLATNVRVAQIYDEEKRCNICREGEEDLEHVLLQCKGLEQKLAWLKKYREEKKSIENVLGLIEEQPLVNKMRTIEKTKEILRVWQEIKKETKNL